MKNLVILLTFSFLFFSCKDSENTILNPNMTKSDQELQNNIIGTWGSDSYKITYYGNNIFTDTIYDYNEATDKRLLDRVRTGRYEIKDGIIFHSDIHYTFYGNPRYSDGVSIIAYDSEISDITGDYMARRGVEVFSRAEGNGDDIWGKWITTHWVIHLSPPEFRIIYEGREENYFIFNKDSAKVTYGWKYLDSKPWIDSEYKTEYKYEPPYITLNNPGIYNEYVVFKNGKMLWYPSITPEVIRRIERI